MCVSRVIPVGGASMERSHHIRIRAGCRWRAGWRALLVVLCGCLVLPAMSVARAATWSIQPVPDPTGPISSSLSAVSCSSPPGCTAVGSSDAGMLAERWNGDRWTLHHMPKIGPEAKSRSLTVSLAAQLTRAPRSAQTPMRDR